MNAETLRTMNPEYKYRLGTDKDQIDFIYGYFGYDILETYLRINPQYGAARADFFRYLLIYRLGGIYLDIKSNCAIPFRDMLRDDDAYILSHWGEWFHSGPEFSSVPGGEYTQWHVIASPGHAFLECVINAVLANIHDYQITDMGVGQKGVLRVTGPVAYTLAIHSILHLHPHRFLEPVDHYLRYDAAGMGTYPLAYARSYKSLRSPVIL
jgi:hypothetical protein